jgi:hypothetical protein
VPGECACYDEYALYCHCVWRFCPKCGAALYPAKDIKREGGGSEEGPLRRKPGHGLSDKAG